MCDLDPNTGQQYKMKCKETEDYCVANPHECSDRNSMGDYFASVGCCNQTGSDQGNQNPQRRRLDTCGCEVQGVKFCNHDYHGPSCEACSEYNEAAECYYSGLPDDGVQSCIKHCFSGETSCMYL